MKSWMRGLRHTLFAALWMGVMSQPAFAANKIRAVTGYDYAPYADPKLEGGGLISQVIIRVFSHAGYTVEIGHYPWARSYKRVKDLQSDITFPYAKNAEREAVMLYSRPVNEINVRIFESAARYRDLKVSEAELSDLTYCQPLGYQTEKELANLIDRGVLTRFEATDMVACFKALGLGRVDFVVSNDLVAWEAARKALGDAAISLVKGATKPISQAREYVIVSRDHPKAKTIIEDFNRSYQILLETGALDAIWRKALGEKASAPR